MQSEYISQILHFRHTSYPRLCRMERMLCVTIIFCTYFSFDIVFANGKSSNKICASTLGCTWIYIKKNPTEWFRSSNRNRLLLYDPVISIYRCYSANGEYMWLGKNISFIVKSLFENVFVDQHQHIRTRTIIDINTGFSVQMPFSFGPVWIVRIYRITLRAQQ